VDAASVKVLVLVVVVIPECISRIVNTTTCRAGDVSMLLLDNVLVGLPHDNNDDDDDNDDNDGILDVETFDGSDESDILDIKDDEKSEDR